VSLAELYDAFLIDLDGVVWRGDAPIAGAADAVRALREMDKSLVFVTNNASRSARDYAAKLMRMHIPTAPSNLVTSAHAVVAHLYEMGAERGTRVHVLGTPALSQVLRSAGFEPTAETDGVDAVVVAWNPALSFEDVRRAADVARSGVPLIGANRDATYPAEHGLLPGTGAILASVEVASGCEATVVGKPAPYLFRLAMERCGVTADRAIVIGDRADSDVAGAHAAGLPAALVLTGVTRASQLGKLSDEPEWVLPALGDVLVDGRERAGSGTARPRVRGHAAFFAPSAEGDDEHEPGDEPADVG
jgi:glycerol-1-phosphatase